MGFTKKKEEQDRFIFTKNARQAFASEMEKLGFDFDAFLIAKGAIAQRVGGIVALEYRELDEQAEYVKRYLSGTPFYTLEATTLEWAWRCPLAFWQELRVQARDDESNMLWRADKVEAMRSGKSHEDRARDKMSFLAVGMKSLIGKISYEKARA